MKKKLFIVSDIHGFFSEMKKALEQSGFEENNCGHMLIFCGDFFDRGEENRKVLDYFTKLKNCLLIRGNHEDMLLEIFDRGYLKEHNYANGTLKTINELFGEKSVDRASGKIDFGENHDIIDKMKKLIKRTRDYYESENYIFTHGWLPLEKSDRIADNGNGSAGLQASSGLQNCSSHAVKNEWRWATKSEWREARWTHWIDVYGKCRNMPGKTLVVGHVAAAFAYRIDKTRAKDNFDIYSGGGIMAIDGGTSVSRKINVVVIEDNIYEGNTFEMSLVPEMYGKIECGGKTVEMRLYDEKRALLRPGDRIVFTDAENPFRKMTAEIKGLHKYSNFTLLAKDFAPQELGINGVNALNRMMYGYYGDRMYDYDALAIEIELI